jgi:hypothetical protein
MTSKSASNKTLPILTGVCALLYLAAIVNEIIMGSFTSVTPEAILYSLFLLILLAGFILSWKSQKQAGIVLLAWTAGIWIIDLIIIGDKSDSDSGIASAAVSPVLVIGAFLLLGWYKTSRATRPSQHENWKFILRVLMICYAVLYSILVIAEITGRTGADIVEYISYPWILFPILLLVFAVGFLFSFTRELIAGIVLLIWSAIWVFGFFAFTGFSQSGPWLLFGLPILLQALFYLKIHFEFRTKE